MILDEKVSVLGMVGLFHALTDGSVVVISLLFPIFRQLFDLSYTQVGVITGGGLFITLISQIVIGWKSDMINQRTLLLLGVLLMSASMLLLTKTSGFLSLICFVFFLRFAASFFHPVGVGWISRLFRYDRLDWAMGIQSAFGNLGAFVAIFSTPFLAEVFDWHFPFYIWAILGVCLLFCGMGLTYSVSSTLLNKKPVVGGSESVLVVVEEVWRFFREIKLVAPAVMLSGSSWGIIVNYLPLLLVERTSLSLTLIGVLVSVWLGVGVVGCVFYGRIQSFFGRKVTLVVMYFMFGVMSMLLSFVVDVFVLIVIMVFLGLATFLTFPAIFSYVSEITHETVVGKTFGYVFTLQLGGGTVLLFFGGVLGDVFGIWSPFLVLGFLFVVFSFLLMVSRNSYVGGEKILNVAK